MNVVQDARHQRAAQTFKPGLATLGFMVAILGFAGLKDAIAFFEAWLEQNNWLQHHLRTIEGVTAADATVLLVTAATLGLLGQIGLGSVVRILQLLAVKLAVVIQPESKIPSSMYFALDGKLRRDNREDQARASFDYSYTLYYFTICMGVLAVENYGRLWSWVLLAVAISAGLPQAIGYFGYACFQVAKIIAPDTI